jgi:hypothetical protein
VVRAGRDRLRKMAGNLAPFRATREESVVSVGDSSSIAYTDPDARPFGVDVVLD